MVKSPIAAGLTDGYSLIDNFDKISENQGAKLLVSYSN